MLDKASFSSFQDMEKVIIRSLAVQTDLFHPFSAQDVLH